MNASLHKYVIVTEHKNIVALETKVEDKEKLAAIADCPPCVILDDSENYSRISFPEYKNFKVWSCDIQKGILKICLIKE